MSPNIIDMGIALAAGAAGAFANVNKRVSASIAGVAIAVALVPPLGVVGLTLHAGLFSDALGAFLLFMTNLVSIILAAMVVFALTGFVPIAIMKEIANDIKRVAITVGIAAIVIAIPLAFTGTSCRETSNRLADAHDAVEDRSAHVHVGRCHVDLGPQHTSAVLELPGAHAAEEIDVFVD